MKLSSTQKKLIDLMEVNEGKIHSAWMMPNEIREANDLVSKGIWITTTYGYKEPRLA